MAESDFQNIEVCVFDAYGTLFDVHSPTAKAATSMGGKAGAVSELWRRNQLEYTWLRSLMPASADFWQVTGDGLDYALEANGIDDEALRERLMELYLALDAYPDVRPALEALRAQGLRTGILSNGNRRMLDAAVESAGLSGLLDASLSADDVGVYKPDPKVYRMAANRFGIEDRSRICFVSSNAWDASGAAGFGFSVAWMNRFGMARERLPGTIKSVIGGLDELPPLLG